MQDVPAIQVSLICKGLATALVMMSAFAVLLAAASAAGWEESTGILNSFNYLSVVIGSVFVGVKASRRVWLHGLAVGVGYMLVITLFHGELAVILQLVWIRQLAVSGLVGLGAGLVGGLAG